MNRLTVEKEAKEMTMTELAHNNMFVKNGCAWYRDFLGEKELRELIRELNEFHAEELLSDDDDALDEELIVNLQYNLCDINGLMAFIYRNAWAMADLRERLKQYEDLGLTPEQLKEVDRLYTEKCEEVAELTKRLKEYVDLENRGLLLRLPCKIGDTVYWISNFTENIRQGKITDLIISKHGIDLKTISDSGLTVKKELEKVFLTKQKAEQALKERESHEK